jgi:hypothetical protein
MKLDLGQSSMLCSETRRFNNVHGKRQRHPATSLQNVPDQSVGSEETIALLGPTGMEAIPGGLPQVILSYRSLF